MIQPTHASTSTFIVPYLLTEGEDQFWISRLQQLTTPDPQTRLDQEADLQDILDKGFKPPSWFLDQLQEQGYSISCHPETISHFKTFSLCLPPSQKEIKEYAAFGVILDKMHYRII